MSEPEFNPPLSRFVSDSSGADDVLDVDRHAMPIAALIESRAVMPPLCVGIFGAEGSGVTFFLRRIATRIDALTADRAAHQAANETAFCSALQITYNPWHYVGANQWLTLAERIFEALQSTTHRGGDSDNRQESLWQIGTAGKLLRELESKRDAAQRVLAIEQQGLARAEKQYIDAVEEHAEQQSQPPQAELNDLFARRAATDGSTAAIDDAGARLGLKQLSQNGAGLRKVLAQAKTPVGRASLVTSTLTAQKHIGSAFLVFLLVLLGGSAAWVLTGLYSEMRDVSKWVETVESALGALASLGTFLVLVAALLLGNRALSAADALQPYERALDAVVADVRRRRKYKALVAAQREAASLRQVADSRERVAEALRNVGLAEQAIADLHSGGVQRAVIDEYRSLIATQQDVQPSLVPMIREDFKALSRHLLEQRSLSDSKESPPERIIIYIDDLDRCPPATVVDVIQAIQLILAFPVFVVVIGANPAWLARALATTYSSLMAEEADTAQDSAAARSVRTLATFIHIPYWIRPVSRDGAVRLAREMLAPRTEPVYAVASASVAEIPRGVMAAPDASVNAAVELTTLTEPELSFLEAVAVTLVESLRDVKRLANCYRILRLTLAPDEQRQLVGDGAEAGGYLAAIAQLAIVIAAPLSAPRYVELLGKAASLDDLIASLEKDRRIHHLERDVVQYLLALYRGSSGRTVVDDLRAWIEAAARHSFTVPPAMAAQAAHRSN